MTVAVWSVNLLHISNDWKSSNLSLVIKVFFNNSCFLLQILVLLLWSVLFSYNVEGGGTGGRMRLVGWRGRGLARRRFIDSEKRRRIGSGEERLKNVLWNGGNMKAKQGPMAYRADRKIDTKPNLIGYKLQKLNGNTKRLLEMANQVATQLTNFDRGTIRRLLRNKEKSVGEIVLVDGRPALIKKRVVGRNGEMLRRYEAGNMNITRT